ncbi:hypothetical protein KP509_10G027600 [Ceratopteris richardii]|nr:hypothetical protein KP509_10G027600 [Ceratopteris richardii]
MMITSVIQSVSQHMCFTMSQKVAMKVRSIVAMAVFNKLMETRLAVLRKTSAGHMLNLITNDSQKLLDAVMNFHFVWFAVVEIFTVSILAILEVGVSAVPGVVIVFLLQPLQASMARAVVWLRRAAVKYTDTRVQLLGETLAGIRLVKYNGWVDAFLRRISAIRKKEMQKIRLSSYLRASTSSIKDTVTPLASLVTFATYIAIHQGKFMLASKAFTLLALFGILVRVFSIALLGVQSVGEAIVAIKRLKAFMEIPSGHGQKRLDATEIHNEKAGNVVCLSDCSFTWESVGPRDSTPIILQDVNLTIKEAEKIAIIGSVGSGKSSLLYGILGEIMRVKGVNYAQQNIVYVSQQPWILNGTVRENIVFSNKYDAELYKNVVSSCALEVDILQLPACDDSEIGERGVNLSGGQKARISLARACYSLAPIVLLDDPLAAVDSRTAKHLIEHVLHGLLKNRTVIMVTHNKMAIDLCDCVYSIDNGRLKLVPKEGIHDTTDSKLFDQNHEDDKPTPEPGNTTNIHETKITSKGNTKNGKITVVEDHTVGEVTMSTYKAYAKAGGGYSYFVVVAVVFLMGQAFRVMVDYWLSVWSDQTYNLKSWIYIVVYAGFSLIAAFMSLFRAILFTSGAISAAIKLHGQMANSVLRSPQVFFDQNSSGRILNRFSKDQEITDEIMPITAQQMLENMVGCIGSMVIIAIFIPWFLLCIPPFVLALLYFGKRYIVVSRELKRLDGISRSPIYAHFVQTFQGIVSVRAFEVQSRMHDQFASLIDTNNRAYILFVHVSRWLGIRLDFCAALCVTVSAALVIFLRHSLASGLAGVVLLQSLQLTGYFQYGVRLAADTENYFTSVERIKAYTELPTEADPKTKEGIIGEDWPSHGEIVFESYTMAYREDLPPALNNLSFKVNAGEKVGILGRTGAGKSSLVAALFRMVENQACHGSILIDGVNIRSVGLDDLRQRISIVPQDPTLFRGTLRLNLDPFEQHEDNAIYEALGRVNMLDKVKSLGSGLDSSISENGENLSVGERQLLCLARCLLRRSKIIVMDEATASIDTKTDELIQRAISEAFTDCTVLIIAHRINTVIDSDRVLVLVEGGRIVEFDSPINLLRRAEMESSGPWKMQENVFASMVAGTGPLVSQQLREAAEAAEVKRFQKGGTLFGGDS